jgi:polyribonucleotide nucleotidyltransferase
MSHTVQTEIHGQPLSIETGKVAKQADGAVVVRFGGTLVLATVVAAKSAKEAQDFFPLTVEYRERAYAGGRIPGGYFKREGAPVKKETLSSRLIDRPIRPLFPDGFRNEVQVICLVVSGDPDNDPDVLAINGASAALCLSGIPFGGPVGAVRVGLVDGQLVANPTTAERAASQLELVVAGTEDGVLMVEAGAREVPEDRMLEAIAFGHEQCKRLARIQKDLAARAGKPRWTFDPTAGRDGPWPSACAAWRRRGWPPPWPSTRSRRGRRRSAGCSTRCGARSAWRTPAGAPFARPSRRSRAPRCAR